MRRPPEPAPAAHRRAAARLAPAVRAYLGALVGDPHLADELSQQFLLKVLEKGFRPPAGRRRAYLRAALRNTVRSYHRRRRTEAPLPAVVAADAPVERVGPAALEAAWERLAEHERQNPRGRAYTVLRLAADFPDVGSAELAERLGVTPTAFRKQLSRARQVFARLLDSGS